MEFIKNIIREKVSGQRNRLVDEQFNLDITAITPRVLAMSFPAVEDNQKWYRNSIKQVRKFIQHYYGDKFHVFNVSGTIYEKNYFNDQVTDYQWEDHHSPSLKLLFEACLKMHNFLLEDVENVVIVHCNAGKGRTGTLISCYLQFCGYLNSAQDAITYYGWKRFKNGKGVTQPSQLRYIFYFQDALNQKVHQPVTMLLDSIIIPSMPQIKNSFRIQIQIYNVSNSELICKNPQDANNIKKITSQDSLNVKFKDCLLSGNLLIKIVHFGKKGTQILICRLGIHTSFLRLTQIDQNLYEYELNYKMLDPNKIKSIPGYSNPQEFKIKLLMREACEVQNCLCKNQIQAQQNIIKQKIDEGQNYLIKNNESQIFQFKNNLTLCKLCFKRCNEQGLEQKEWEFIQNVLKERENIFNGHDQQQFGIQLMFGVQESSDHLQVLELGHDKNIFGLFESLDQYKNAKIFEEQKKDFDLNQKQISTTSFDGSINQEQAIQKINWEDLPQLINSANNQKSPFSFTQILSNYQNNQGRIHFRKATYRKAFLSELDEENIMDEEQQQIQDLNLTQNISSKNQKLRKILEN